MTVDVVRPPRPAQVTVAFWLQLASVTLVLGIVGLAIAEAVYYDGEISRVASLVGADPVEVRDERAGNIVSTLFIGLPALVLALWLGLTARPMLRGSNIARILIFVAGGGQLLLIIVGICGGFLLAPLAYSTVDDNGDVIVDDGVSWEESEFLATLYSSTETFSGILFVGVLLVTLTVLAGTVAVVLLLALPPANRYFVPKAPHASQDWQTWPPHPAIGPMPYYICPDPSAHLPAEPPTTVTTAAGPPPDAVTAEPTESTEPPASAPAPAPAPDEPKA